MNLVWYSVLRKVQSEGRSGAEENPADGSRPRRLGERHWKTCLRAPHRVPVLRTPSPSHYIRRCIEQALQFSETHEVPLLDDLALERVSAKMAHPGGNYGSRGRQHRSERV
jgi:hypothetical protein